MFKFCTRVLIGVVVAMVVFAFYRFGMYLDTLMSVKTPFYFTIHNYISVAFSIVVGFFAAIGCDDFL